MNTQKIQYCPNCGHEIPAGVKFCGRCGYALPSDTPQGEAGSVPPASDRGTARAKRSGRRPAPRPAAKRAGESGPRPKPGRTVVIAAAAVVVLVVVIIAAVNLIGGSLFRKEAYIYFSDGKYKLLTSLDAESSLEIASSKSNNAYSTLLSFSPDGEYIYYFTKYDSSSRAGTLCRARYGKLKEGSSKNDDYIETIASNVSLGINILDDGTVLYKKDDNLYAYDGESSVQLAKSVNGYRWNNEGQVIYTTGTYSDGYILYGLDISSPDEKVKLASNYDYIYSSDDFDCIFYTKAEEDGSYTLYVTGMNMDTEKLGKRASMISYGEGEAVFAAVSGETVSLYDYVDDPHASEDEGLKEPDQDDYTVPRYSYVQLYSDSDISGYGTLYTSCSKKCYFCGDYSMEYKSTNNFQSEQKQMYSDFVDKYQSRENEDGYLEVTDDVRADLINMAETMGNGYDNEWLEFCFVYAVTGEEYDYDAYESAWEAYDSVSDRIELREQLRSSDAEVPLYTIFRYRNGGLETLAENVLDIEYPAGAVIYNTLDMVTDTVNMDSITQLSDVRSLFSLDYAEQNMVMLNLGEDDMTTAQLSASAADTLDTAGWAYAMYSFDSEVIFEDGNDSTVYAAPVSGGTVGAFSVIAEDADICLVQDSTLYYIADVYSSGDYEYGDLYSYSGGKTSLLASDIMADESSPFIAVYDDGTTLAATGLNRYGGYELTMFSSDGTKKDITDGVTQCLRLGDGTLLYISDEELYSYDGSEKTVVSRNAQYVWTRTEMEPVCEVYYFMWDDFNYEEYYWFW